MNTSIFKRTAIAFAICLFIISASGVSQAQRLISYQGIVTDASNMPVTGLHTITASIYTTDTSSTPFYNETQKVMLSSEGLFNLLIGKVKPLSPLPVANPKDRYYLGIEIDASAELTPRSPFSDVPTAFFADTAGYARNTLYADTALFARSIDPSGLNIIPTTVNGLSHAVTLAGGGGTTVSTSGDSIIVFSVGSQAIQQLLSSDGTITIVSPNGPVASLGIGTGVITAANLADGSVTTSKIVNGAVSNAKLSSGAVTIDKITSGASSQGQVLTTDGAGGTLWQSATATTIALPYTGTASSSASVFSITNSGSGIALLGTTSDGGAGTVVNSGVLGTSSTGNGVAGLTNSGTGVYASVATTGVALHAVTTSAATSASAGIFENLGANATSNVLIARSLGSGDAGYFQINSATNTANGAVEATTSGKGSAGAFSITNNASSAAALSSTTSGTGSAGLFQITNTSSAANALQGTTASTSNSANGIYGWASNSGGTAAGIWGQAEGAGADAIIGLANNTSGSGVGLYGLSRGSTGVGIYGESDGNTSGTIGIRGVAANNSLTSGTFVGVQGDCYVPTANGYGIFGEVMNSGPGRGVYGLTGGSGSGVYGQTTGIGNGVFGINSNASGYGIQGQNSSSAGTAILGLVSSTGYGVWGQNSSSSGTGILGLVASTGYAVWGQNQGSGYGVYGQSTITSGTAYGVVGIASNSNASGIGTYGQGDYGVKGITIANGGYGVWGSANGGTGYGVYGTNGGSGTGTGSYATAGGTGNALISNYAGSSGSSTTTNSNIAIFQNNGANKARIDLNGVGYFDGGTQNSGADVAESFTPVGQRAKYDKGDVLVLSSTEPGHVEKSSSPYSTCVAGVFATKPGVLLTTENVDADLSGNVPMGVIGVIPTKVSAENGPIAVGDLMVTSSTPGHAMKGDPDKLRFGNILGKAMEPFNGKGSGVIKVLVGKY